MRARTPNVKPRLIMPSTRGSEGRVVRPAHCNRKVFNGTRDIDPRATIFVINYCINLNVVGARTGLRDTGRWVRAFQTIKIYRHTLLPLTYIFELIVDTEKSSFNPLGMDSGTLTRAPIPAKIIIVWHTLLPTKPSTHRKGPPGTQECQTRYVNEGRSHRTINGKLYN